MKIVFFLILMSGHLSYAHEHHHEELKASAPAKEASVWQLGSSWKNKKGETKNISELKGKPRLLVMLFTRCETACPLLVEDLKEITKEADKKRTQPLDVAIFSLDSFRETPESLASFANKRKLPAHWELYTSDANAVAELAAVLGVRYKRLASGDFIHSNVIYFLNEKGEVVAQKEGIKTPQADFIKKLAR